MLHHTPTSHHWSLVSLQVIRKHIHINFNKHHNISIAKTFDETRWPVTGELEFLIEICRGYHVLSFHLVTLFSLKYIKYHTLPYKNLFVRNEQILGEKLNFSSKSKLSFCSFSDNKGTEIILKFYKKKIHTHSPRL